MTMSTKFHQTGGIQSLKLLTLMAGMATTRRLDVMLTFFFSCAQDEITFPGEKKRVHAGVHLPPWAEGGGLGRAGEVPSGGFSRRYLAAPPLVREETPVR